MKHATKLKLPPIPIYSAYATVPQAHIGVRAGEATTVITYGLPKQQLEEIMKILPPLLQQHFHSVNILQVRKCFPHSHLNTGISAINYYIETNGETTAFHEDNEDELDIIKIEDPQNGYIAPPLDKIVEVESYVAEEGDMWLINLETAHSVTNIPNEPDLKKRYTSNDGVFRLMMHISFNLKYDVVLDQLKKYIEHEQIQQENLHAQFSVMEN